MNILSNFPERLSELMDEKNLKAKDLALKIGISRNTVTRYLQGVRLPSYQNFIKIIGVLDCSADFLLGTEDFNPLNGSFKMPPPFCDRFRRLLEERKISQYALHKITGFSYDNFNKWLSGATQPYVDNLIKLSKAFDCSVDFLIGRI